MDFLILGVNGMAGHAMAMLFQDHGHNVVGFAKRKSPFCETIVGDARCEDDIYKLLNSRRFDVVVNCIGVLNKQVDVDVANGIYLNSYLPHHVATLCSKIKTKFIHLSTDCVFEGHGNGCYTEISNPDATTAYGRSKALGEVSYGGHLTMRTSIVGPDWNAAGIGLFNWFMRQTGAISGFSRAMWTGVSTITLARAVEKAAESDLCGLYHLVNGIAISKYDLLKLFAAMRVPDSVTICDDPSIHVDKSLVNTRSDFDFSVPSYESMVKEMYSWIIRHRDVYPHYEVVDNA